MEQITVKGKSAKGKNRVREHGQTSLVSADRAKFSCAAP
jgi:hypothetical protein